jgi:hypothetical protein
MNSSKSLGNESIMMIGDSHNDKARSFQNSSTNRITSRPPQTSPSFGEPSDTDPQSMVVRQSSIQEETRLVARIENSVVGHSMIGVHLSSGAMQLVAHHMHQIATITEERTNGHADRINPTGYNLVRLYGQCGTRHLVPANSAISPVEADALRADKTRENTPCNW